MPHPEGMPHAFKPKFAVIEPNTLAVMGLSPILQSVSPMLQIDAFASFEEFMDNEPEQYVHIFVNMGVVLANMNYFAERRRKTIVLTTSEYTDQQFSDFHTICTNVSEKLLVKNILNMAQTGHPNGKNLPPMNKGAKVLSDREVEVLALVAQGLLNKEIADKLNIGLTTVITHRKNITDKLGIKTVSALTVYAVMHGYVDIGSI